MEPLQGTKAGETQGLLRVRYTHDAMIDVILTQPAISQKELAVYFGYTEQWVSRVLGSDSFQARLAQRKDEVVTPGILATMNEKITALAHQSLEIVQQKLGAAPTFDGALKALELSTKALGMGARPANINASVQNTYVVALPEKSQGEEEWAAEAKAAVRALGRPRDVVEAVVKPAEST